MGNIKEVIGFDYAVTDWVAKRLGMTVEEFMPCTAIGYAKDGELVGGIVFNNYHKSSGDIQLTAVSDTERWLNKQHLRNIYNYVYNQLGCVRTTAVTGRKNKRTRRLLKRLGYRLEGVCRKALDGKRDAMVYGQLRHENRWVSPVQEVIHGKVSAISTRPISDSTGTSAGER